MDKTFYCTRVWFEVLSETPITDMTLDRIGEEITIGDLVGGPIQMKVSNLTGKEMAKKLLIFGSEPSFFQLDDKGKVLED